MKKAFLLIPFFLFFLVSFAQSQKGIVKTRGRMVNGELVPGTGLSGASIYVRGRNRITVQKNNGSFSFPVQDGRFHIDSVYKADYQLVDMESIVKDHVYSSNPLYFVMETPERQLQDLLAAKDRIRDNLYHQLQKEKARIRDLNLSIEEQGKLLQHLYDQQSKNEKLIDDIAKRYAAIDYDQMDDFYRQVNYAIEQGKLVTADSLLRSKGDLNKQVINHIKEGQELLKKEEQLQKEKSVHSYDKEELARRCQGFYETFSQQFQRDSAAHYIRLKADLDTSKIDWQVKAGNYFRVYLTDYVAAQGFMERALRNASEQFGENSKETAAAYNGLGSIYAEKKDNKTALDYYQKALASLMGSVGGNHLLVAKALINIGFTHASLDNYDLAHEYYLKALEITELNTGNDYSTAHASALSNMGAIYLEKEQIEKAQMCFLQAIQIEEAIKGISQPSLAISYSNLATTYSAQNNYTQAIAYFEKAREAIERSLPDDHPIVASLCNNIGSLYYKEGDVGKAIDYITKSVDKKIKLFGQSHPSLIVPFSNLGFLHDAEGQKDKALDYYFKALDLCLKNADENTSSTATLYANIGSTYEDLQQYSNAIKYYTESLSIRERIHGEEHPATKRVKDALKRVNKASLAP